MRPQVWNESELLLFLFVLVFLLLLFFRVEKWFGGSWGTLKQHKVKILFVWILTAVFFPIMGLIAQFFDRLPLAAIAWELTPSRHPVRNITRRIQFEAEAQTRLRKNCREDSVGRLLFRREKGGLRFKSPAEDRRRLSSVGEDDNAWMYDIEKSVNRLAQLLPGSPPLPVIEVRELYDSHGHFTNPFSLAINSDSDEPVHTVMHELTHLYLLWSLIPGFPVDCPRWLNEGLAEHVSGEAMNDAEGWGKYAMVRRSSLVDLDEVSPAFSWSGREVEWQARDAVAMLLDQHGENTLHRLINGLRLARPFHSVYPIVTGRPLDAFASAWKEKFTRERVLESQTRSEILSRLLWLANHRGFVELQPLLKGLPARYLSGEEQSALTSQARLYEANKSLAKDSHLEALGWLRRVDPDVPGNGALRSLIEEARQSKLPIEPAAEPVARAVSEKYSFGSAGYLFAWVLAFLCSGLLVAGYTILRPKLAIRLKRCWQSPSSGVAFRWLVVGLTGLIGAWFLRFLVISMIPYGGLAALSDLHRIMLAETLVIFLWLALAWQISRWNFAHADQQMSAAEILSGKGFSTDLVVFLAIGIVPPLLAAYQAGWQPMGFEVSQMMFSAMLFMAGSAAFGLVVWEAAIQWSRGAGSRIGPVLIYALFRGGLVADPYGSLFALVAGWRLVELARSSHKVTPAILGDIFLCGPALLLCTGWFPACDPVGGYWHSGGSPLIWWLPAAFILLLFRGAGQENGRQG